MCIQYKGSESVTIVIVVGDTRVHSDTEYQMISYYILDTFYALLLRCSEIYGSIKAYDIFLFIIICMCENNKNARQYEKILFGS